MVKLAEKSYHLPIAIKENYNAGMKPKEIVALFHISKKRVNYWIYRQIKKRKRRLKFNRKEINIIVKWAKDKPLMEQKVSTKNIQIRFKKLPKKFKEKKKRN